MEVVLKKPNSRTAGPAVSYPWGELLPHSRRANRMTAAAATPQRPAAPARGPRVGGFLLRAAVLFGHGGLYVTVVDLNGADTLYVEADRLLVHDATLQVGTLFMGEQGGVRGVIRGAVTGQGLFTTTLAGHGSCGLLSHGGVMELPISPQRPIHVDPQAYVAHRGQVQNKLTTAVGVRELIGRGSGEGFQLELSGSGVVYVQASERKI